MDGLGCGEVCDGFGGWRGESERLTRAEHVWGTREPRIIRELGEDSSKVPHFRLMSRSVSK